MKSEPKYENTGKVDEADVTQEVAGAKSTVFGIAIDSEGRSNPTHMIPYHVRQTLARWWTGEIPWYDPSYDPESETNVDTVASLLAVTVGEAEDMVNGTIEHDNSFLNYTDVPLCQASNDRLAFWAYNQDAIEFDPSTQFEAQVEAVDAMSQLFIESMDFHFHFLMTLDAEYHRQRATGPLGVMDDESNSETPWHTMYHWWRGEVERAYLDSGLISLPTGLRNSNWTIADVMAEVVRLMVDSNGNLLSDIVVTEKGLAKAKTGISLGIYADPGMTDNDGNPRFYQPCWRSGYVDVGVEIRSPNGQAGPARFDYPIPLEVAPDEYEGVVDYGLSLGDDIVVNSVGVPTTGSSVYLDTQHVSWYRALELAESVGRLPLWARETPEDPTVLSAAIQETNSTMTTTQGRPDGYLRALPDETGLLSESFYYWRGHQLNLVELIGVMRRIGRVLEPEVLQGFIPMLGRVTSIEAMLGQPSGLNSRLYDDLINSYSSSFAYNENPARKYTAAHLGPLDRGIARGELVVGDNVLHTETTDADGNTIVPTVREEFWTPGVVETEEDIARIMSFFIPGGEFNMPLLGDLALTEADSPLLHGMDKRLVSRLLGTKSSMLTKVEKPVVLPAGVELPEATFASGVGVGGLQLIVELVMSAVGGKPFIGLGHNGYIDWRTGSVANERNMPFYPATRTEMAGDDTSGYLAAQTDYGMATSFVHAEGESYDWTTFVYAACGLISSKVMSMVGVDPIGVAVGRDAIEPTVLELADKKATSLYPVGAENSRAQSGQFLRLSTDTATIALHNAQTSDLPIDLQMPVLMYPQSVMASGAPLIATERVTSGSHYFWAQAHTLNPNSLLTLAPATVGSEWAGDTTYQPTLQTGVTATVPKAFHFTKGDTTVTVQSAYVPSNLVGMQLTEMCGSGGPFAGTDSMGRVVGSPWDGRASFMTFGVVGPNGLSLSPYAVTDPTGNGVTQDADSNGNSADLMSSDAADHALVLVPGQSLMDQVLTALAMATPEEQLSLTSGTQSIRVGVEMGLFLGWTGAPHTSDQRDQGALVGAGWFGDMLAEAGNAQCMYDLTWANYNRPLPEKIGMDVTFERTNLGGEIIEREADSRSFSQSYLIPVQDNEALMEWGNNVGPTVGPGDLRFATPIGTDIQSSFTKEEAFARNDTVAHLAYNPREAPGGEWGEMTVNYQQVDDPASTIIWPIHDWIVQLHADQVTHYINHKSGGLDDIHGHYLVSDYLLADYSRWYKFHGNGLGLYGGMQLESMTHRFFGAFAEMFYSPEYINVPSNAHLGGQYSTWSSYGCLLPQFLGDGSDFGLNTGTQYRAYALCAGNVSSATYIIPDDPDVRMVYRPYRRLVDAAVAKELKQLLVPTHERYDGAGGPLGLPFYGSPTPFRFAQLALEAGKPDQFILEPGASKSRMIDSKNRGMLTFGKLALLDADTQRHELLPLLRSMNADHFNRRMVHGSSLGGTYVFNRDLIRDIQLGRQFQRMR